MADRDHNGRSHGKRYQLIKYTQQLKLHLDVEVPEGITCHQCVLQWRYVAGNSWGCEPTTRNRRRCGMGFGAQESFYNCADIAILPDCGQVTVGRRRVRSVCEGKGGTGSPIAQQVREQLSGQPTGNANPRSPVTPAKSQPQPKSLGENQSLSGVFGKAMSEARNKVEKQKKTESQRGGTASNRNRSNTNSNTNSNVQTTNMRNQNRNRPEKKIDTEKESNKDSNLTQPPKRVTTTDKNKNQATLALTEKPTPKPTRKPKPVSSQKNPNTRPAWSIPDTQNLKTNCHAIDVWSNLKNMHNWCRVNCLAGYCPSFMCACPE